MGFQIKHSVLEDYIPEPGVTDAVIPNRVTEIGFEAFTGTKI